MDSPSMLYIQEGNSLNSARIVRVPTLHKALDALVSVYIQVKCKRECTDRVLFDMAEALEYYQNSHEIRYYEEIQQEDMVPESLVGSFQSKSVKVYNKKSLLDELVDYSAQKWNPQEEVMEMEME